MGTPCLLCTLALSLFDAVITGCNKVSACLADALHSFPWAALRAPDSIEAEFATEAEGSASSLVLQRTGYDDGGATPLVTLPVLFFVWILLPLGVRTAAECGLRFDEGATPSLHLLLPIKSLLTSAAS